MNTEEENKTSNPSSKIKNEIECTIGSICSRFSSGKGITAEKISPTGEYPVYGGNGVRGYTDNYNFEGQCVVIGRQGANCGNVKYFEGKAYMSEHAIVGVTHQEHDNRYFAYKLSMLNLGRFSGQAAQPGLSVAKLKTLKMTMPNFNIQYRIASILSAYDHLIENNTRRIRLLEQMAENLYKEWFVRFRFPEHEKVEMVNGLPKGWRAIHIKELAQLKSGYAFKSEWFIEEGEAVAKIKDIGNILMDTSSFSYVDKENCIKAKKFLLTTGDLTIALTGATIGKISIVPKHKGNIYTNQRLGKFFLGDKPMEKLPFLYCLFKQESMVSNIVNLSNSSSAQPNISPEQIEKIKILGNHDIISMYNKTCNPLFSNILALYSQIQLLTRQRDLLLPRLMSGKLEVKS